MKVMIRSLLLATLMLLAIALPASAQEMNANSVWKLADSEVSQKQYDEAASTYTQFAQAYPSDSRVFQAWRSAIYLYRDKLRNEEERKNSFNGAIASCEDWLARFAADTEKVWTASWEKAYFYTENGQRATAITVLDAATTKYAGTAHELQGLNQLATWSWNEKRYAQAIEYYKKIRTLVPPAAGRDPHFNIAQILQEAGLKVNSITTYRDILAQNYNIDTGCGWKMLDAAKRLRNTLKEEELCLTYLQKIRAANLGDKNLRKEVNAMLGIIELPPKSISSEVRCEDRYSSGEVNLVGGDKMNMTTFFSVNVRARDVSTETPFKADLKLAPKVNLLQLPAELKEGDVDAKTGRKTYGTHYETPNAKNESNYDWRYEFTREAQELAAPSGVEITRKWDAAGDTWGMATIRIKAGAEWHLQIKMPNGNTKSADVSPRPDNTYAENGSDRVTFDWNGSRTTGNRGETVIYDLSKGATFSFPVTVGEGVKEYHPVVVMWRQQGNRLPDATAKGTSMSIDINEFTMNLTSDNSFPYGYRVSSWQSITLTEVK
ncbi:MAG: tetratricopeptide repeat protein [bacterium]